MKTTCVTLAAGLLLAACGGEPTTAMNAEPDTDGMGMSLEEATQIGACNEARGALYRLGQMAKGVEPISESDLGHGAGFLRQLADVKQGPPDIQQRIEEWRAAVVARSQEITSLPPRFENGRVIEPDTTDMDRRMLERITQHGPPLVKWVQEECGDLEDPFA